MSSDTNVSNNFKQAESRLRQLEGEVPHFEMAGNCLQHMLIVVEALETLGSNTTSLDNQKRVQYNYLVDQLSQTHAMFMCLRDSLQQLDGICLPKRLQIELRDGESMPVPDMSLSSGVALPEDQDDLRNRSTKSSPAMTGTSRSDRRYLTVEEESTGTKSDPSTESESSSVLPSAVSRVKLARSNTTSLSSPRCEEDEGKKKKGFARKRGFSGSSKKKPLPPPIPTTSTPPGVLLSNSVIPESLLNDIAEPRIQLNVHIPNIGFYFKTAVRCSLTVKEVKLNFMKKMASVCTEKQNPDSYYIHAKGLRILDETLPITAVAKSGDKVELVRPFEYELLILDQDGNPEETSIVATETLTVAALIQRKFPKQDFSNAQCYLWLTKETNGAKTTLSLSSSDLFVSYGIRKSMELRVEVVTDSQKESVSLKIAYSPFDLIDQQKQMLTKTGWLKKQGGSKGGNKASWTKRWFVIDSETDRILYYVDSKSKEFKGAIELATCNAVEDVTAKFKDGFFYFEIVTDRTVLLRGETQNEVNSWVSTLKQYLDLARYELAYDRSTQKKAEEITTRGTVRQRGLLRSISQRKKSEIQRTENVGKNISAPFMAKKLFSVNADWKWNSDEDPLEVFEFQEILGVGACGKVLKATHKKMGDLVLAVKIVKQSDKKIQEELEKEVEILKKCKNPNVIAYYGTVLRDEDCWILMDYCGVGSVKDVSKATGENLEEEQCRYVVQGTLKGLAYMHNLGILHLDIKAANKEGIVKLADFGVSAVLKTNEQSKEQSDYIGSPLFMAPEIIRKEGYNSKADIWSLGITIIEMCQGRPPNTDINSIEKLPQLAERAPPTFKNPKLWSPQFNKFLATVLVKNPNERPSAIDLLVEPFMAVGVGGPETLKDLLWECIQIQKSKRKKIESNEEI